MKIKIILSFILIIILIAFTLADNDPWTNEQLMKPIDLVKIIKDPSLEKPIIFNIGPSGKIPGSTYIGSTQEKENLQALEKQLQTLPKNKNIVIYCGCCPFKNCPNIRPAFLMLNEKGFTNHKLLNLPQNLKVDWIDKGYPISD